MREVTSNFTRKFLCKRVNTIVIVLLVLAFGTANAQTVEAGFRIILKDPKVKAILINIFGGIVRCDRVAQGVIDAYNTMGNINVPIIVRLQGTNAEEAKKLIDESGLKVQSAILLSEAASLVNKAVSAA